MEGHGQMHILEFSLWQPVWWLDRRRKMEFGVRHRVTVLTGACHLNLESGGRRPRTVPGIKGRAQSMATVNISMIMSPPAPSAGL